MDLNDAAPGSPTTARGTVISDQYGHLTIGAMSQIAAAPPAEFADFLIAIKHAKSSALLILGATSPPPCPKGLEILTLGCNNIVEVDLVHAGTGAVSKLFGVYDPALVSGQARRRCAIELTRPYLSRNVAPVPPIVLIGGTPTNGSAVYSYGSYIIETGVFDPLIRPSIFGGTILRIDLDQPDNLVEPTFRSYGGD